jgi:FkbM family methyltransferase
VAFAAYSAENRHLILEVFKAIRRVLVAGDILGLRLAWLALNTPRKRSGVFRFRFGDVRYLDAQILYFQYVEIIRDKCYDFRDVNPRPTIFDCGGNIGMSVIRFKMLYPNARITVFEADPAIAQLLTENLSGLGFRDVSVMPVAVGNVNGSVAFLNDGLDGGRVLELPASGLAIPSIRLADQINEPIDMLKLDIEGAEFSIVSDLVESSAIQHVRRIACELHCSPSYSDKLARLFKQLVEAGFSLSIGHACPSTLPGPPEPTPFTKLGDGHYLAHLYAWRSSTGAATSAGDNISRGS